MILKRAEPGVTAAGLCRQAGFSRQAYYKERKARRREAVDSEGIVAEVRAVRKIHRRMGGRKLLREMGGALRAKGIGIGRDRFFAVLRAKGLLIKRWHRGPRMTESRHGLRVYPNRIRRIVPSVPDQVWVSDMTYLATDEGFVYLSLITDAYSRKIVGYHAGDSPDAAGSLAALRMALRGLRAGARPIHHSDRGGPYCSGEYVRLLRSRGLEISMTETNHCSENAKAERINGILKQEYGLGERFRTRRQAKEAVPQGIGLYNDRRPHMALDYRTPSSVHAGHGEGVEPQGLRRGEAGGKEPPGLTPASENTFESQGGTSVIYCQL